MKTKFTLLASLVVFFFGVNAQQLSNPGFETWTDPKNPDGWVTFASLVGQPIGLVTKDTADKVQGSASVKIKTDSIQAGPQGKILLPEVVSLGTGQYAPPAINFNPVFFPFRPDTLFFAYKYVATADTAFLSIVAKNGATSLINGGLPLPVAAQWNLIFIPITGNYANASSPDSMLLQFTSSIGNGKAGSTLNVDAIRFGYVNLPSFIEDIRNDIKVSVFPNPSNNVVNIEMSEAVSNATVMVYDMNGRVMTHEFMTGNAHQLSVNNWASGLYTYVVLSGDKAVSKGRLSVSQ